MIRLASAKRYKDEVVVAEVIRVEVSTSPEAGVPSLAEGVATAERAARNLLEADERLFVVTSDSPLLEPIIIEERSITITWIVA